MVGGSLFPGGNNIIVFFFSPKFFSVPIFFFLDPLWGKSPHKIKLGTRPFFFFNPCIKFPHLGVGKKWPKYKCPLKAPSKNIPNPTFHTPFSIIENCWAPPFFSLIEIIQKSGGNFLKKRPVLLQPIPP